MKSFQTRDAGPGPCLQEAAYCTFRPRDCCYGYTCRPMGNFELSLGEMFSAKWQTSESLFHTLTSQTPGEFRRANVSWAKKKKDNHLQIFACRLKFALQKA